MEALTRYRYLTQTLKFNGCVFTHKTSKAFSQIPNAEELLKKFYLMKKAEETYKERLLNELVSECSKNMMNCQEKKEKKVLLLHSPVTDLQKYDWFSNVRNTTDELLSYLEPFPFDWKVVENMEIKGNINLYLIKSSIEKEYLAWKFKVNLWDIETLYKRLTYCIYKFRSLRNLNETVSLLETLPMIQELTVAEKIYHINQKPFDLNCVKNFQNKIAGVAWHVFPQHCPKILQHSHQYILFIVSILEVLKFTEKQIQIGLPFLHYNFISFVEKLNNLLKLPELEKYKSEPEFLQLLFFNSKILSSLVKSNKTSFQDLIESVSISAKNYQKRVITKKSIQYLTSLFYKVDAQVINRFCFRNVKFVPETQVYETLAYLKEAGFTDKEVEESLLIIFYPSYLIARTLEKIKNEDQNLKKIGFSDGCVMQNNIFMKGTKERRKLLQLCLYYMEKPFCFSGDGIWVTKESAAELKIA